MYYTTLQQYNIASPLGRLRNIAILPFDVRVSQQRRPPRQNGEAAFMTDKASTARKISFESRFFLRLG